MSALPSLKGLRAVEAAARLGSFTAAAVELCVTQTAVSRLVKLVEDQLQVRLFERHANALTLTAAGTRLLPHLSAGFARLSQGVAELRRQQDTRVLTLAAGPSFAMRWLIPRLARFHALHPDIDVRLTTALPSETPELRPDWNAAIRLLPAVPPGLRGDALFHARLLPVCRPEIAARLRRPADLAGETLLRVSQAPDDWPRWFAAQGLTPPTTQTLVFDFTAYALLAALDGLGVALAREPYVQDDLAARRLVAPFGPGLDEAQRWYLLYREEAQDSLAFRHFREWLLGVVQDLAPL
ncbi:MAG TPA: LysR substrate-binding domain-containing protein [Nevskiales bacterium]|nr:LysR substrate-binding domain-containing protein [Nevskiales bacterium]